MSANSVNVTRTPIANSTFAQEGRELWRTFPCVPWRFPAFKIIAVRGLSSIPASGIVREVLHGNCSKLHKLRLLDNDSDTTLQTV